MRFAEIIMMMNREQYIEWLVSEHGMTYKKACEYADFMGVRE